MHIVCASSSTFEIFRVSLSLNDDIENYARIMHFIKAYLQKQDLGNKEEIKFHISFTMVRH